LNFHEVKIMNLFSPKSMPKSFQPAPFSPKRLDEQCVVPIHAWVDYGSAEWKAVDDDPIATEDCICIGCKAEMISIDTYGRVWVVPGNGQAYPLHVVHGDKNYGIRFPLKAAN
jgi:hypothetical protein